MVEQQFKANLKWISDKMQGITLSNQKTKEKYHNTNDCVSIYIIHTILTIMYIHFVDETNSRNIGPTKR